MTTTSRGRVDCPVSVSPLFERKISSTRNGAGHGGPVIRVEVDQPITGRLQEPRVRQFGPVRAVLEVQHISILERQLEEVLVQLGRPALASPGKGVILDELIKKINSPHMLVVVADDSRALNLHLLVVDSPTLPSLPPLGHLLLNGLVAGRDHRDEPDIIPQDAKHILLTPPQRLSFCQQARVLADVFEDSGGSTHQSKGPAAVDAGIIQFLGKGYGVVVVVHEQVVTLPTETIH